MAMNGSQPEAVVGLERRPILDDITVVIPTVGRPIIEDSLNYLAVGNAWPRAVIVVDQGAQAAVAAWVARLQRLGIAAHYVPSNQHGRSSGINRGLERVRTRFVAVTDDDCFVTAGWLEGMAGHLRRWPEAIITGRVDAAEDDSVEFCTVTSTTPTIYRRPQLKVHPLIGGNMGAAMATVERIGLFDEHPALHSAEDSDWGYRALRLGIPIAYMPEVVVRHHNWRTSQQRAARYRDYSRSQGGFYGKYLLSGDWLIPVQVARELVRGPLRWLRGRARGDQDMIDRGRADSLELLPGILAGLKRSSRR
jgi:GT2 family glycosyltransferase